MTGLLPAFVRVNGIAIVAVVRTLPKLIAEVLLGCRVEPLHWTAALL